MTLVSSRRRCAICFGLNRDTSLKVGQIAHLDHDASNNTPDNLVFLCFDHHDQYDSTTRQSKNITKDEILVFRQELTEALNENFSREVSFGPAVASSNRTTGIEGHFIRITDGDFSYQSAEIKISRIVSKRSQYHVSGHALWGRNRPLGPNIGEFDHVMELENNAFYHAGASPAEPDHSIHIRIDGDKLTVSEQNWRGIYGMNVNFIGEYQKVG